MTESARTWWRNLVAVAFLLAAIAAAGLSGSSTPAPTDAAQAASPTVDEVVTFEELSGGGGPRNNVKVTNQTDGRLRLRSNIQLNHITGKTVAPVNYAEAYASCTDCDTIAIALQINLIGRDATRVVPKNAAVAINFECLRCRTASVALQYVYSVDDPKEVPDEVEDLVHEMDRELTEIARDHDATLAEVVDRINAVLTDFVELADSLDEDRDETEERTSPNATPPASPEAEAADGSAEGPDPTAATSSDAPAGTGDDATAPAPTSTPTPAPTEPPAQPTQPPPTEAATAPSG